MRPYLKLSTALWAYCSIILLIHISESANHGSKSPTDDKPNIIIILADDLIPTPNIDALGIMGIQLNQMYVAPLCTPSRSSLMTGKYPSNLGMQHSVVISDEPFGLGLEEKTIAEYMKSGDYRTYLVGKWHLGFFEKRYTPLYRGFDSHFGYLGPYIDYFNHSLSMLNTNYTSGYDMRDNLAENWDTIGQYATDLFTKRAVEKIMNHHKKDPMFTMLTHLAPHTGNENDPMQAPEDEINKFSYIQNEQRRTYAAMVSKLDESVGKVVKALDENDMLDNTIILFMSDNGAPVEGVHANAGSNFPFKGQKDSPWEGAIRSAIWSTRLKRRQRVSNQMVHITDWLPTFAKFAGVIVDDHIDGMNVWDALSNDSPSPRREILVHYDQATPYMAYISDNFKLVSNSTSNGIYDRWLYESIDPSEQNSTFGSSYNDAILMSNVGQVLSKYSKTYTNKSQNDAEGRMIATEIDDIRLKAQITCNEHTPSNDSEKTCDPFVSPCIFDIFNDPCETTNLATKFPDIVAKLTEKLEYYGQMAKPTRKRPIDRPSNPANFGGIWTWWNDELIKTKQHFITNSFDLRCRCHRKDILIYRHEFCWI